MADRLHFISVRYTPEGKNYTREVTITVRDDPERTATTIRVDGLPGVVKVTKESYTIQPTWTEKRVT